MKKIFIIFLLLSGLELKAQSVTINDSSIIKFMNEWMGVPYKFGGNTKKGIDCSQLNKKFYQYVYKINLPDVCYKQYNFTTRIQRDSLKIGDLVFFRSTKSPSGWHCGCYIGNNNFLHAPQRGERVKVSSLEEDRYKRNYKGAGRIYQ
jgi:lipoprotein Spr